MAVRVCKNICDGCNACAERRLGLGRYWYCTSTPRGHNAWRLEDGELAPVTCPIYKAQVREVPLFIVCGNGGMFHRLEQYIRRGTAWDVRVRTTWCHTPEKMYGLRDFEVWFAARWQESPMIRIEQNHAFLFNMIERRRRS